MENSIYYDGTKLLSLKDIEGNLPEMYFVTTNRSGGKTTWFNKLLFNRWVKQKKKFMLVYRFKYELSGIADKFFSEIQNLFFQDWIMKSKPREKGIYHELFAVRKADYDAADRPENAPWEPCGYAVAINCADTLKRVSHLFADTDSMLMDEFQSETGHYAPDEVNKLRSIHASVARGGGKQIRRVPIYFVGNPITILNPYYVALGISARLTSRTNYIRGVGWVLEQGFNEAASKANIASAFNRAFGEDKYFSYQSMGVYLNDSQGFIEKPEGHNTYIATIKADGKYYGLRVYSCGFYYIDDNPDMTYPVVWTFLNDDHTPNTILLNKGNFNMMRLRKVFDRGEFRFKNLECKQVLFAGIGYSSF